MNKHRVVAEPGVELLYIDANNLYGQALSTKLPQKEFVWVECSQERQQIMELLPSMDVLGCDTGYTFEVDLVIPPSIHDLVDDLPLAPENRTVQNPTSYMTELWALSEGRRTYRAGKKLLLSHLEKENYVVHFALLKFYLEMGVQVTKVHRIVRFHQASFFEACISFNSKKRQVATTDFEKDFFKLKNNGDCLILNLYDENSFLLFYLAVYGKTLESVRKRNDFRLCMTQQQLMTYASRPLFKAYHIYGENCVGVELAKTEVNTILQ